MVLASPKYDLVPGGGNQTTITFIRDEDRIAGGAGVEKTYTISPSRIQALGAGIIKAFSVSCSISGSPPSGSIVFQLNSVTADTYTVDTDGSRYISYMTVANPNVVNTITIDVEAGTTINVVEITSVLLQI